MSIQVGPGININIHVTSDTDGFAKREYVDQKVQEAERGEIKTVNGEAPDENGNVQVSGLPEGATAYQQLVTDGEGKAVWEERPFYSSEETEQTIPRTQVSTTYVSVANTYGGTLIPSEFKPFIVGCEYTVKFGFSVGICNFRAIAYMDEVTGYIKLRVDELNDNSPYSGSFSISHLAENATQYTLEHSMRLEDVFTLEVSRKYNAIATIDPRYLPTTVPVIQSASVGQTIVVKAVDEDGKPTEWEGSPKWLIDAEDALAQNLTAGFTVQELQQAVNSGWIPNVMIRIPQSDIEHGTKYMCGSLKTLYLYERDDGEVSFDLNFASPSSGDFEILVVYSTVAGLFNDT